MSGVDFTRVRRLFEEALDRPPAERTVWLAEACGGDATLLAEVQALLAGHSDEDTFLEPPDRQRLGDRLAGAGALAPGDRIDAYEVVAPLATGGMGTVYEARQRSPDRRVALKVLRASLAGSAAVRRFRYETEVLGRLRHDGIAQIHEAGTAERDGVVVPWFAMELVEDATDLLTHCADGGLPLPERLELFTAACDAIHHGHQRGVIHRDVKAGNVLVDGRGRLKVIDFGVAKAVEEGEAETQHTRAGDVVGTLRSMSPEQLRGDPGAVDVRADVYALGVLLYELATGRPPHDLSGRTLTEIVRLVGERDPVRPSALDETLPVDLDWIVMKALEKDPDERYASAAELAADVRRLLADEPVLAGEPGMAYRTRKFVRRHRLGVLAAAVMLLLLVGGATGTTLGWLRSEDQREKAEAALTETEAARVEAESAREQAEAAREEADAARERAELEADKAGRVVEFMVQTLGSPDPSADGADLRLLDALDRAEDRIGEAFASFPEVEALLRSTLGRLYYNLGAWEDARRHLTAARQARAAERGVDDVEVLLTDVRLGSTLSGAGQLHAAEDLIKPAVDGLQDALPASHPYVIEGLDALALVHQRSGKAEDAELLYRRVLDLSAFTFGPDHRRTLLAQANLAALLIQMGRVEDARFLLEETLASMRVILGDDDPQTATVMANLAMILIANQELTAGAALLDESIDVRRRILPADHPDLILALGNLGSLYYMNAENEKARAVYADLVPRLDAVFAPLDPYAIMFRCNYATVLEHVGDAEGVRREVAGLVDLDIGARASNSAQIGAIGKLADALVTWGRHELALDLYREMDEGFSRLMAGHPNQAHARGKVVATLRALGRDAEADALESPAGP